MKLKKQQLIIVGVIIIAFILVASVAVVMMSNNDDGSNGNGDGTNGNGDGTNGDTNGDGDGDGDNGNGGSSQLTGNWVNMSSNIPDSNLLLTDVFFLNENEGWITSSSGDFAIYHTTDGGLTFETQTTALSCDAIYMFNENEGFAGGQSGAVYHTNNGGTDWNMINNFLPSHIRSMSFPPESDTGFICGGSGWVGKINATEIFDMEKLVNADLSSISFSTKNEGWLCGGSIIRHYVSGEWVADQNYPYGGYNAIHFIDNSHGWAAGDDGIIIHTTDGYNWTKQIDNVGTFDGLFFLDELNGWALNFQVMSTNDGGNTWNTDSSTVVDTPLVGVFFISPNKGFVVGGESTFLKYTGE